MLHSLQAQIARLEKRNQEVEKQNQELHWQIAMLAKDPEAPALPPRPQPSQPPSFQEAAGTYSTFYINKDLALAPFITDSGFS